MPAVALRLRLYVTPLKDRAVEVDRRAPPGVARGRAHPDEGTDHGVIAHEGVARWENIAAGQPSAASACRSWMDSPGHRANILGNYNRIGLGFWSGGTYGRYYVQVFARAG